eukprot:6491514-Amphidinium_carterae.3
MQDSNPTPSLPQVEPLKGITETEEERQRGLQQAQREVGALLWVANRTRPDVAAMVGILASDLHYIPNPVTHLTVTHNFWRYLKEPVGITTLGPGEDFRVVYGATDASFAPNGNARSRFGVALFLAPIGTCRGLISWCSQKQSIDTISAPEAEIIALHLGSQLLIGLQKQLQAMNDPNTN